MRIEEKLYLIDRIWDQYSMIYSQGEMVDFEDMVVMATVMVDNGCRLHKTYDRVLIDEYQDVSSILVGLVTALRRRMGFRLFCVGDDWQSIYSFSGGDVWETFGFEEIWSGFGDVSIHRIERTYRCPQALVEMTNRFVSKNPMQMKKAIKGHQRNTLPPVQLLPTESDWDIARVISNRLEHLDPKESVLIIGRTRNDVNSLTAPSFVKDDVEGDATAGSVNVMFRVWDEYIEDMRDDRVVKYMTAHSSKGLEADNVFIIADRDRGGFPSMVYDDISELFHTRDEGIEYAEERRVLYVAMTRARKRLFIINRMDEGYVFSSVTPMIQEIITDNIRLLSRSTPVCRECAGPMKIVRHRGSTFYGCLDRTCRGGSRPFEGL
jgi:DNA helicase-4